MNCFSGRENVTPGPVGQDNRQFEKMIDTARLAPDVSAMIPGRLERDNASSWQAEVQRAVFKVQTNFACGLDGMHGADPLRDSYAEDHFIMMRNQRTFGQNLEDNAPTRMNMWCGPGRGGAFANIYYAGLPVSISLISGMVPGMMKTAEVRNVTYDCVAIYILPKWDMKTEEFIPDTWMGTGEAPDDLENRYALSFTMCNAQGTRQTEMLNNKNGRNGPKGETVIVPFYEVHGNKFLRGADGNLQVQHCLLSEYDDLNQEKDVDGKPLPEPDIACRIAFGKYMEQIGVSCFTSLADFDLGVAQYKEQFELCTGAKPTNENTSLLAPYL